MGIIQHLKFSIIAQVLTGYTMKALCKSEERSVSGVGSYGQDTD